MIIEKYRGRYIVCGYIYPGEAIKTGQLWQASSGNVVTVTKTTRYGNESQDVSVEYEWYDYRLGQIVSHEKDSFAFQCRYCKVMETYGLE